MPKKSEKINKQIEWYYLLFCGSIYFLIVAHSNGKTMYWVPLLLSSGFIWYFKKKYSFDVKEFKTDLKYFFIIWALSAFLFFYFFIGFDLIPNVVNNDFHYYSALSDHIMSQKSELNPIDPLHSNSSLNYKVFQFYHFTEIWLTGIVSQWLTCNSLTVLLLITYPLFLALALLNLFKIIKKHVSPLLSIERFISVTLIFLLFGTILAIIHKGINTPLNVYLTTSFYAWFKTGSLKLLVAAPIIIYYVNCLFSNEKKIETLFLLTTIGFLYPTLLPITLSSTIGVWILNKILTNRKSIVLTLFLIILIIILHFHNPIYAIELIRTPKLFFYRLGILFAAVFYFRDHQLFYINIVKTIFVISLIVLISSVIKVNFTNINHVDYFQIFDNFNIPLAQLLILLSFFVFLDKISSVPLTFFQSS